ncbi:GapS6a family protein [Shewanella xiamenensis]|uniref:GapS6a family protein n=1 Tax=Shewanella xiamenensis TaxID=332186 RepID=UPI00313F23F1
MEFLSSAILSGFVYDMLKHQVSITATSIKEKLKDWVIDEAVAPALAEEIEKLSLNDEMSEKAIERKLLESGDIQQILSSIKPNNTTVIMQNHSGIGDNVGGSKITR